MDADVIATCVDGVNVRPALQRRPTLADEGAERVLSGVRQGVIVIRFVKVES